MHRVLDKSIILEKSNNPIIRACGKFGIRAVVSYGARIEREVRDVQLNAEVMDNKEAVLGRIMDEKRSQ